MAEPLRLFILAGEASGDRLGADLIRRLASRTSLQLSGIGGPEMAAEGLDSLYPIEDLSVMGWSDVIRRLPLLLWRVRQTARAIIHQRPDVAVLIDSQVFAKAVADRVRKVVPDQKMVLYVAPTVWAWRPERAAQMRPLFDRILAILPFEPKVLADLDGPPTDFVGHPALTRFPYREVQPDRGPLLLLPGSRKGELRRHLPLMREAATTLAAHPRITGFVIPTLSSLADHLRSETSSWPVPVEIVTGAARDEAFRSAYAAFAVSGTVTLELAMAGVPLAATYVADAGQAKRYLALGRKLPVGLPNIILDREVVPELLFDGRSPERDLGQLLALIDSSEAVERQRDSFRELRALMQKGAPEAPLQDAAELVLGVAQRSPTGV